MVCHRLLLRVPKKSESDMTWNQVATDESDVENYFVEDDEEKGDDVAPEPSAWTPALDAGAEIRL